MSATDTFRLIRISAEDTDSLRQICRWQGAETNRTRFCCDPVSDEPIPFTEQRFAHFAKAMEEVLGETEYHLLSDSKGNPLGYATLCDYNPRNRTACISYYLPPEHRGQGLGSIMLQRLIDEAFAESHRPFIERLWAETGAFNEPSVRLLTKFGFHLDGRIREHYWLDGERFDQLIFTLLREKYVEKDRGGIPPIRTS
jgi:RimJ/RimL family protein N-acetyltransferase